MTLNSLQSYFFYVKPPFKYVEHSFYMIYKTVIQVPKMGFS